MSTQANFLMNCSCVSTGSLHCYGSVKKVAMITSTLLKRGIERVNYARVLSSYAMR
jgi:hypothetical protein